MSTRGIVAIGDPFTWSEGVWVGRDADLIGSRLSEMVNVVGLNGIRSLIRHLPQAFGGETGCRYNKTTMSEVDYLYAEYIYLVMDNQILKGRPVYHPERLASTAPEFWELVWAP